MQPEGRERIHRTRHVLAPFGCATELLALNIAEFK